MLRDVGYLQGEVRRVLHADSGAEDREHLGYGRGDRRRRRPHASPCLQFILRGHSERGDLQVRLPRDLQYGPGQPVHRGGVYRHSSFERRCDQHGRQGPLDGQCLYRTVLEKRQV